MPKVAPHFPCWIVIQCFTSSRIRLHRALCQSLPESLRWWAFGRLWFLVSWLLFLAAGELNDTYRRLFFLEIATFTFY
jgi:hypothetical protein